MIRPLHAVFACLFAGLLAFAATGDLLVRDIVQLVAVALMALATVRRPDARVAFGLLTVANASWAVGDLDPDGLSALLMLSFVFAQAGLVAFVGLVAPHLVRRTVVVTHAALLALSALAGGVLLLAADVAARSVIAPRELPVGLLTAVFGGGYLLWLLRQRFVR